jgi:CBS domain-containing protein
VNVGDIMQRRFDRLSPTSTVLEAAHLMLLSGHEALPVMEEDRLVGMIAERDILSRVLRDLSGSLHELGLGSVEFEDSAAFRQVASVAVADLMSRRVITTTPEIPALRAAATMQARHIRRLPVLQADLVVGLVFQADILEALVRGIPPGHRRRMR